MAVPITGWTFQDICMEVKGSYNNGDNSQLIFGEADSDYFNPTYNVQIGGQNHLAMFRDYGSHNAPQFSYSLTVSWVQMGSSGELQFSYGVTNISGQTKTFYVKGDCDNGANSTSVASHTLADGVGTGGMLPITLGSEPSNWRFYVREGNSNFTSDDIVETS